MLVVARAPFLLRNSVTALCMLLSTRQTQTIHVWNGDLHVPHVNDPNVGIFMYFHTWFGFGHLQHVYGIMARPPNVQDLKAM